MTQATHFYVNWACLERRCIYYELARVLLHREEIIISFCISSDLARKQLANSSREVSLSLNFVIRALDYVNGNEVAKSLYKIYANKLKQIIRLAKKLYFDNQLQSHQQDYFQKNQSTVYLMKFTILVTFYPVIKKKLLINLISILQQLEKKLSNDVSRNLSHNFSSYLQNPVPSSMFLLPTTPHEIDSLILNLKLK